MRIVTAKQMKQAEANAVAGGFSYLRLMENAGAAAYKAITDRLAPEGKRFAILCGSGNNGGDGFVIARKLYEADAQVTVIELDGVAKTAESAHMAEMVRLVDIPVLDLDLDANQIREVIYQADGIVDALFGTGFHGVLSHRFTEVMGLCRKARGMRFAVDIPSGVTADDGTVDDDAFPADCTIALDSLKPAHTMAVCRAACGEVVCGPIGIPEECYRGIGRVLEQIDRQMVCDFLPIREADANKGSYGKLLCVCGSREMPGAAVLAVRAALRSGAGLVTLASVEPVCRVMMGWAAECTYLPLPMGEDGQAESAAVPNLLRRMDGVNAALCGCGFGTGAGARAVVEALVSESDKPLLLDADALNLIAKDLSVLDRAKASLVLTPHPGEMARLCRTTVADVQSRRVEIAADFAAAHHLSLVLKGADTVIASADGRVFVNPTGNPGMARGGSGDALSGMIAAFLAQGLEPAQAAVCGVYLHGLAGDRTAERASQYGMLPTDLIEALPGVFGELGR